MAGSPRRGAGGKAAEPGRGNGLTMSPLLNRQTDARNVTRLFEPGGV
jgi:hypothetical protein